MTKMNHFQLYNNNNNRPQLNPRSFVRSFARGNPMNAMRVYSAAWHNKVK